MSEVTVTVRGEHEVRVVPERATVRVSVRSEGAERAVVVDAAMRLADPVRASITERHGSGSVVDWSSTRMTVRSERPWNSEGKQLAPVHHAAIELTATFAEASALSDWVSEVSSWDGVEIGWVDWHLTPHTLERLEREVAARAVAAAVARAGAYATALGLDEVEPVEIADVGLLTPSPQTPELFAKGRSAALASADLGGSGMEFEPDEIVVSATVEARFLARRA